MNPVQRYHEVVVEVPMESLDASVALASSGLFRTYLVYERQGVFRFAGDALGEVALGSRRVTSRWGDAFSSSPWHENPLARIYELLNGMPTREWRAYGWAAYESAPLLHASRRSNGELPGLDESDRPLLHLVIPRVEVEFGPGRAVIRSLDARFAGEVAEAIRSSATRQANTPEMTPAVPPDYTDDPGGRYHDAVRAAVSDIREGLLRKVIISRTVPVGFDVDITRSYLLGRRHNSPARSYLLRMDGMEVAGFSPETVVEVNGDGRVTTQPLAGTRRTGLGADRDAKLRAELTSDAKEIFEHSISVTTAWEEIASVCVPESVAISEYMRVRERGSVQHLASRVGGQLAPGRNAFDAFRALFPSITVSGVPKPAAFACIARHESEPRGLYGGAVLTADSTGALDAALVLRSVFRSGDRTWLRAGAGVVGMSSPEREFQETCEKLHGVASYLVPATSRDGGTSVLATAGRTHAS